jgi:3-hydroxyacyl-CoA dehydrogenase
MDKIAIVGSGVIGQGWAVTFARAGHDVSLYDLQPGAVELARERIEQIVENLLSIEDSERQNVLDRISNAASLAGAVAGAALVQESIIEDADAKRDLFRQMDELAEPDTILASSASALIPDTFLEDIEGRHRCLVAHPFNPPYLLPVVELLPNSWTGKSVLERCRQIMIDCGQVPIVLNKPIEGYIVNRLQIAVVNEAMHMVAEGVASPGDIDAGMREGLGKRWAIFGPFETMNSNAPNGFREYTGKFGSSYQGVGKHLKVDAPWHPDAVEQVARYLESKGQSNSDVERYRDDMIVKIQRMISSENQT